MRFEKWDNVGATKIMLKQIRNSLLKTAEIMLKQLRNSLLKTTKIMLKQLRNSLLKTTTIMLKQVILQHVENHEDYV